MLNRERYNKGCLLTPKDPHEIPVTHDNEYRPDFMVLGLTHIPGDVSPDVAVSLRVVPALPSRGRKLVVPPNDVVSHFAGGRIGVVSAPSDGHVYDPAAALVEKDVAADVRDVDEDVLRVSTEPPEERAEVWVRVQSLPRIHEALVRALGGVVPAVDG